MSLQDDRRAPAHALSTRTLGRASDETTSGERELAGSGEREPGEIIRDMWENGEKLAQQEIALGLAELQVRADKFKASLLKGAITGAVYNAGTLVLLAALVLGLSEVMAPWLAASIVGALALGIGYAMQRRSQQQATQAVADFDNPPAVQAVRAMADPRPPAREQRKEGIR